MHSIPVPKGTYVFIAIQAANINPDLWGADAHVWRPERWLAPLPGTIAEAKIPGVYSNLCVPPTLRLTGSTRCGGTGADNALLNS